MSHYRRSTLGSRFRAAASARTLRRSWISVIVLLRRRGRQLMIGRDPARAFQLAASGSPSSSARSATESRTCCGRSPSTPSRPARELPGAHEDAGDAWRLGTQHIGLDVVTYYHGRVRRDAEPVQGHVEERACRLADHGGLDIGGAFEPQQRAPVSSCIRRRCASTGCDAWRPESAALDMAEQRVELLVADLGPGAAQEHDVGLVVLRDQLQTVEVLGDVAAGRRKQRAPRSCSRRCAAAAAAGVRMSSGSIGKPASASSAAIRPRLREVVFVSSTTARPASRTAGRPRPHRAAASTTR